MRWEGERESSNVEDRRGAGGGMGGGPRIGGRGIGLGTIVIAFVAAWLFGVNPMTVLSLLGGGGGAVQAPVQQQAPGAGPQANDEMSRFVRVVLASTEDVWRQQLGSRYREPVLVLFSGRTPTGGCGVGDLAAGPFYCPADQKVYIDLRFYETLRSRLGAPGDTAQAYVIAHEVGHHVQNLLGIMNKVDGLRSRLSEAQNNALSVRVELQADCFAGIWGFHSQKAKGWFDQADIQEAINAAGAVGDDKLQREATGVVRPERFTHGTSEQRARWFMQGYKSGDIRQCDTFAAQAL
ncbi:metalloprotease [beta proteobacterium AAP99]|nr:metalloprotease [beta proteobacterium AAP99]